VPALKDALLRVQELENALDEEHKRNEQMKKATATELIGNSNRVLSLEEQLHEERQRNTQLKNALAAESARVEELQESMQEERRNHGALTTRLTDALAAESARVADLEQTIREERRRHDEFRKAHNTLLAMNLNQWISKASEMKEFDKTFFEESNSENCASIEAMNQEFTGNHDTKSIQRKVMTLMSNMMNRAPS
jgi:predicted RNase H-like nuclease (RuvC/YqgF family)